MQQERTIVVHQSLHRHSHTLGAEREPVMITALLCVILAMGGATLISAITALVIWLVALFVFRRMNKADPIMSQVFLRHIKHQNYYSAKSSIWRKVEGYKVKV